MVGKSLVCLVDVRLLKINNAHENTCQFELWVYYTCSCLMIGYSLHLSVISIKKLSSCSVE